MTQRTRTILARGLAVTLLAYWCLLVTLTHMPKVPSVGPNVSDKIRHLLAYGLLAGLLFLTVWGLWPRLRWLAAWVLVIVCAYAAIDELTQPLTGRAAEFGDWLADGSGALLAVVCLSGFRALYPRIRFGRQRATPAQTAACTTIPTASVP